MPGPGETPKKDKSKDDDKQKLPPVTPSISGSETSPEMSRNVDDLRNRDDLIAWFDSDDDTVPQPKRRTVKPNVVYNRRRITKPGTDIKKELEELATEIHGRWQEEPSPLKIAAEQKKEPNRRKTIVPFVPDRTPSPSRSLDFSTSTPSSLTPTPPPLSPSPRITPRYGPLFDSYTEPDITLRFNGVSLTIRNALSMSIILFCVSLIILAVVVYKLKYS